MNSIAMLVIAAVATSAARCAATECALVATADLGVVIVDLQRRAVTLRGRTDRLPIAVAASSDSSTAYVAHEGGSIAVLDLATLSLKTTVRTEHEPEAMAIAPQGEIIVITNKDGTLTTVDTRTGAKRTDAVMCDQPCQLGAVTISPDGQFAIIANRLFVEDRVSPGTGPPPFVEVEIVRPLNVIDLGPVCTGCCGQVCCNAPPELGAPTDIAVDPDGASVALAVRNASALLVSRSDGAFTVIDPPILEGQVCMEGAEYLTSHGRAVAIDADGTIYIAGGSPGGTGVLVTDRGGANRETISLGFIGRAISLSEGFVLVPHPSDSSLAIIGKQGGSVNLVPLLAPAIDVVASDVAGGCADVQRACAGDCSVLERSVTVDEIVLGVGIALGHAAVADCLSLDRNSDQTVGIEELVAAVVSAIRGCDSISG